VGNAYVGQVPSRPPEASVGAITWTVGSPTPPGADPAPALPPGLSINAATGQITGTPTSPVVNFPVTITATDSSGKTGSYVAHITIYPTLVASDGTDSGTTGTPINPFTPTVVGGNPSTPKTYSVTSGSLPPGLAFDTATGKVTGTPTATGT